MLNCLLAGGYGMEWIARHPTPALIGGVHTVSASRIDVCDDAFFKKSSIGVWTLMGP